MEGGALKEEAPKEGQLKAKVKIKGSFAPAQAQCAGEGDYWLHFTGRKLSSEVRRLPQGLHLEIWEKTQDLNLSPPCLRVEALYRIPQEP